MKVLRGVAASIGVLMALSMTPERATAAAEDCTCAGTYLLCLNTASRLDGFLERTSAEQRCNLEYYSCVLRQIKGA